MTEQQIKDGYDRLGDALAPPLDGAERISRRMVQRRRRRRVATAGSLALAAAGIGGYVVLSGPGPGGEGLTAVDRPSPPVSTLVLTRPDGSTHAFPDVTVSCEPPRTEAGDPVGTGPGRIWMYSPITVTGTEESGDQVLEAPFVYFEGIVAKLRGDRELRLPVDGPGDTSTHPLVLFVADDGGAAPNEVVSSSGSGTVRVVEASCTPEPVLVLEVDATLGSEVGGPSLDLAGTVGPG